MTRSMRGVTYSALLLLILSVLVFPVRAAQIIGPNIDITSLSDTAERQQVEPSIAIDPRNPSVVVASAQDYRLLAVGGHRWLGYYRSTDAGLTWSFSLLPGFPGDTSPQGLSSPLHGSLLTTDPVVAFDRSGNVYLTGIATGLVLFVAKYVNDGATYEGTTVMNTTTYGLGDKPWITVDTSTGPNKGNVYVTYDAFAHGLASVVFIRSVDGGSTFSAPTRVEHHFSSGVTVDPQGRILVSSVDSAKEILVASSTAGGVTFNKSVVAAKIDLMPNPLPGNFFRTFTVPQIASDSKGVYVVWDDFGTGDSDVLLVRSTDGGLTWTTPVRVNDVTVGQQFFPSIAVAGGVVSVVWYDSRLGQLSNGTITGLNVFYAESTNSGSSFSASMRVTTVSFNPNLVERADFGDTNPFMGDYIRVAASPGIVHAIWADNRDACSNTVPLFGCTNQDIFTATITP